MVTNDGLWDWDRIGSSLPRKALDRIASVPPPRAGSGSGDTLSCGMEKDLEIDSSAKDLCGICGGAKEDLEHVLRSCAIAKGLWLRLIPSGARVSFFSLTFKEWFCKNLFDRTFVTTDDEWPHRFAIMCWLLWKRRCRLLLEEDVGVLDDVLVTWNCLLMQTKDVFTMLVGSNGRNAVAQTWCRPQPGWVKMNVDTSVSITEQTAGVGGVIRDDTWSWRFGFARFVAQRGRELGAGSSVFYLPPEGTTALVIQEQGASGAVPGMHARGAPVISGAAVEIG
ncbi:hypothetical protein V6N11_078076 [Hibiscus sabdariffa]|uniref:Reverse transcriptase zinc-binding domain-containing protein n=1 Tax=Hibiscus sabdariffa TaxID=183260 RepID=A0ABR2TEY6_9ROSI